MPGETTQVLAEFAASLNYDDIPERVREYCKDVLLDTLACAVAGHQGEETHQIAALSAALGAIERKHRHRRRPPVARRRDHAQRLISSPPSPCATPIARR